MVSDGYIQQYLRLVSTRGRHIQVRGFKNPLLAFSRFLWADDELQAGPDHVS